MLSQAMSPAKLLSIVTMISLCASRPAIPKIWETTARGENGGFFFYSRKNYDYKYKESPPSIKVTRNLLVCESLR